MTQTNPLRVLHSFPHRLGKARICTTAWYEIDSAAGAGAEMTVIAGDSVRPFARPIDLRTTFSLGRFHVPYRLLSMHRMCAIHDKLVARRLPSLAGRIDIIHAWPLGAIQTIRAAKKLGIPVAMERCNAHTRFAYEVVRAECVRIGVPLPVGHEHEYNEDILKAEELEYQETAALLCPSDFVVKTFRDYGFPAAKLERFIYGVDEKKYFPQDRTKFGDGRFRMIYVGVAAVRKGLHFALEAWLNSPASKDGEFLIVGGFIPEYRTKLAKQLEHPSIRVLNHRDDVPDLMRKCDVFIMPSIEEGFGLVCTEAIASGCVPIVSDACTDLCQHEVNSLVHAVADVPAITDHINRLYSDRDLLSRLRAQGLQDVPSMTWAAAGRSLISAYRNIIKSNSK